MTNDSIALTGDNIRAKPGRLGCEGRVLKLLQGATVWVGDILFWKHSDLT
jgi:hypothetical protein